MLNSLLSSLNHQSKLAPINFEYEELGVDALDKYYRFSKSNSQN